MGLRDLFRKVQVCPECRSRGAVKALAGRVRCPSSSCKQYDPALLSQPAAGLRPAAGPSVERAGSFDPGSHRITIRYRNFQGDDVEFEADGRTVRFAKDHLSVCVVPTGRRIALAKKFIRNLNDLEPASETAARLSAVDRQILGYHRKHGTTSARYEALLRRCPDLSGSS